MAVQRIGVQQKIYDLGHHKLYRDDLEEVARAVAEIGDVKITCGEWCLSGPSDFGDPSLPDELPDLTVTAQRAGTQAALKVTFTSSGGSVTLTEPDALIEGVLSQVFRITRPRLRIGLSRTAEKVMRVLAIVTLIPCLGFTAMGMLDSSAVEVAISAPIAAVALAVLSLVEFFNYWGRTILINAYHADRPTFWQRTRDDWVIGGVMLLLGGVLGYLVNMIT